MAHNSWDRAFAEPELPKWLLAQRSTGRGTRGQLTVYLRLNGAKVPSVCGPSADDRTFG